MLHRYGDIYIYIYIFIYIYTRDIYIYIWRSSIHQYVKNMSWCKINICQIPQNMNMFNLSCSFLPAILPLFVCWWGKSLRACKSYRCICGVWNMRKWYVLGTGFRPIWWMRLLLVCSSDNWHWQAVFDMCQLSIVARWCLPHLASTPTGQFEVSKSKILDSSNGHLMGHFVHLRRTAPWSASSRGISCSR